MVFEFLAQHLLMQPSFCAQSIAASLLLYPRFQIGR